MKSIMPRQTSSAELKRIFRACEQQLAEGGSVGRVRKLYPAMQVIEFELRMRKSFPRLEPKAA